MKGKVIRIQNISRNDLRNNRTVIFVFGDNMASKGLGGQATAMRGEPNAIGIPTKWLPENTPNSFFADSDWDTPSVRHSIMAAFNLIEDHIREGRTVIIPSDGIGTGLSRLKEKAPKIYDYIKTRIFSL